MSSVTSVDRVPQLSEENDDFWREIFIRHYEFVVERMSPDFGLIDKLYSTKVLTNEEKTKINAESTIQQRNRIILECMSKINAHRKLIEMLEKSEQTHLSQYLKSDGKCQPKFGGEWPLMDTEFSILDTNFDTLVELLDTLELDRLYQAKVINRRQREFISSKPTYYEKNGALLDIIRRGSINSYWKTVSWLRETNQGHIAELLEKGGVVVPVHSNIDNEQTEDEIITNFANTLRHRPLDESRRILQGTLNVIALRKGQSIIIYIYCKTLEEITHLRNNLLNGDLKSSVKTLFVQFLHQPLEAKVRVDNLKTVVESTYTQVLQEQQIKNVSVTLSEEILLNLVSYFSKPWKGISSETLISDLPLELLDIILKKVYLFSILPKDDVPEESNDDVIIRKLMSVDLCWFKRIVKKRFNDAIRSYLKKLYKIKLTTSLIYKHNKQFVQENFQLSKDLKSLKRFDCLSDVERAIINRKAFSNKQKQKQSRYIFTDLPALAKFCDDIKLNAFVQCLRRCGERFMERIINNTEAVIKVEFRNKMSSRKLETIEHNAKRHQLSLLTQKAEKMCDQLKDRELEILNTVHHRETVAWVWVNSSETLRYLSLANNSTRFHEKIREMVKERFCMENSGIFNIDSDQMLREFEFYTKMDEHINATLEFTSSRRFFGITKLRNNIYAHIEVPDGYFIEIYEDKKPFRLLKRIEIKGLKEMFAIISDEKENCIHAFGHDASNAIRRCLIRVTENDSGKAFEVSEPLPIGELGDYITRHHLSYRYIVSSVCIDGEMMIFDEEHPLNLSFFGSKGELLRSVSLHEDIVKVSMAVQTSTGHLIVLCDMKKSLSQTKIKEVEDTRMEMNYKTHDAEMNTDASDDNNAIDIETTAPDDGDDDDDDDDHGNDNDLNVEVIKVLCKLSRNGRKIIGYFDLEAIDILGLHAYSSVSIDSCDCVFLTDTHKDRVYVFDPNLLLKQFLKIGQKGDTWRLIGSLHDYEKKQLIVQYQFGFKIFTLRLK